MKEFESPRKRLLQAIRKAQHFQIESAAFLKSNFHSIIVESDPGSGCTVRKLKITKFPPDNVTDLAYDTIETLRSCLDHVATACAILSGVCEKQLERVLFPISNDAAKFEDSIARSCKGIHHEIVGLFRSFKAHPGGNETLLQLNQIRKQGYHRFIVPVGTVGHVKPGLGGMHGKRPAYTPGPIWDGKNNEMIYEAWDANGHFGFNAEMTFDTAFGEVAAVAGKSVWTFLLDAAEAVEKVVNDSEAKAQSIWKP